MKASHFLVVLVCTAGCGPRPDAALQFQLSQELAKPVGTEIDLAQVAAFAWDTLFVITPYTPPETTDSILGQEWRGTEKTGIHQLDSIVLLVFKHGGKIVRHVTMPRSMGDFASVNGPWTLPREHARVRIEASPSDSTWRLVKPVRDR